MKKLLALLLVGIMIFSLVACGDNNTTDPNNDNPGTSQSGENENDNGNNTGTSQTENQGGESTNGGSEEGNEGLAFGDATAENWAQVIYDNFGFELTMPDGWTCTKVKVYTSLEYIEITFTSDDVIDDTLNGDEADTFAELIFNELKAIATGTIYRENAQDTVYENFSQIETMPFTIKIPVGDDVYTFFASSAGETLFKISLNK